jgi:hypothetical protein
VWVTCKVALFKIGEKRRRCGSCGPFGDSLYLCFSLLNLRCGGAGGLWQIERRCGPCVEPNGRRLWRQARRHGWLSFDRSRRALTAAAMDGQTRTNNCRLRLAAALRSFPR